jgi:asparagine synthase (glutamine-hydrolysing)
MRAVAGTIHTRQYWQANPDKTIRLSLEEDYVQLFREKLTNAVNMRCRGVSKPGSELSGGLDSSAVTGIAADYASKNNLIFKAFSNIFPKDSGIDFKDEREFISAMCEFITLDYTGVERLNRDLPGLLQHAVDIQGCYIQQNFSIFSQALYEAAGDQDIRVLLSGFGGDELVSSRIRMPWNELVQSFQAGVIMDELYYHGITLKSLMKPLLIAGRYFRTRLIKSKYTSGVFTPELLDRRFANLPLQQPFADKHALRKRMGERYRKLARDITSWKQYDRIMLDHVPQRMEYCYAAAAQYGLEYRYPLLDIELIETALAFPPWLKQHHGINRYVFRQAIKGFVPEEIRLRNDKSGSTIPQTYFSLVNEREEILKMVKDASNSSFLNEIFDLSRFPEWYERLVRRDPKDMNYLMPGAFYGYLMMLIYYGRDEGQGTRDKG